MARTPKNSNMTKRKNKENGESSPVQSMPVKVWQPGVDPLEEGEELQCDPSAYNSLHGFYLGWPSLSFDIIERGSILDDFPYTVFGVAGTQAEKAYWNSIGIFKLSNISGEKRDLVPKMANGDEDDMEADESSSDEDEENGGRNSPILQIRKVAHEGCVNRIRANPMNPHICASWSDTGHVQIWDFSSHIEALEGYEADISTRASTVLTQTPLMKFGGHKDEGYAIDWSRWVPGRLVSGDCKNCIHMWEYTESTWNVATEPLIGHAGSVEDLQWSPLKEEPNWFASCSADGTIAIWDTRGAKSPANSLKAHKADVNVISWNRLNSHLLASGSDDGTFSVHDLKMLREGGVYAHSNYHKHPITSIEWSPHDSSVLAVSSADNQLTIWNLSMERDEEEEAEFRVRMREQVNAPEDLPAQLFFVHQGQKDLKELHWHPQIPGMIMSTASDGFNVLIPSNMETTVPEAASA